MVPSISKRTVSTSRQSRLSACSVVVEALCELNVNSRWVGKECNLEADGRHFPDGRIEGNALRLQRPAESFQILYVEANMIDRTAPGRQALLTGGVEAQVHAKIGRAHV